MYSQTLPLYQGQCNYIYPKIYEKKKERKKEIRIPGAILTECRKITQSLERANQHQLPFCAYVSIAPDSLQTNGRVQFHISKTR
jgi:hypothetical protein